MRWREELQDFKQSPLRNWFFFALLVQVFFALPIGTNPASRWAALCALVEDGTPRIDAYVRHTIDWSRTPDGHYYSNKAPGPVLVAYPVFLALDAWQTSGVSSRAERDLIRYARRGMNLRILSFLFQITPFFFLAWLWARRLDELGVSEEGSYLSTVALLSGNTACLFLNTPFGHGFAAVCTLACFYFLTRKSIAGSAFFFGLGVLSEYSLAVLIFPLTFFWVRWMLAAVSPVRLVLQGIAGACPPALAWIGYHTYCFGNPFHIANRYQNPVFVDKLSESWNLWGVLAIPSPLTAMELLFGFSRGLLWTQPWTLLLLATLIALAWRGRLREHREWIGFSVVSFLLVFGVNCAFGGWHGGNSAGPRYLTPVIVALAPVLGLVWTLLTNRVRSVFWIAVGVSVFAQLVFLSVYLGSAPPNRALWGYYWDQLWSPNGATPAMRIAIAVPLAAFLLYRVWLAGASRKKRPARKRAF